MTRSERRVHVLVIDEEETLARVLGIALSLEGWEVSTAASGAEALARTEEPDIVLVDMTLPDMLGTEVVAAMRAAGSRAAILFVTGRTDHEHRMAGFRAGADEYLSKPFALEELVDHLHGVVRRLGLAPSSRTVDDLVLDTESGMAWRAGEWLSLTSLEFELLRELVERGVDCYALSNWNAESFKLIEPDHDWLDLFRGIVLSGHEGVTKPDAEIFRRLCCRYGIDPARAVFVDDNPANVDGARAFGMDGVLFTEPDALRRALRERHLLP